MLHMFNIDTYSIPEFTTCGGHLWLGDAPKMVHLHGSGAPHTLAPAPAVGFAFPDFASKTSLISSSEAWGLGRENNVGLVDLVDALAFMPSIINVFS